MIYTVLDFLFGSRKEKPVKLIAKPELGRDYNYGDALELMKYGKYTMSRRAWDDINCALYTKETDKLPMYETMTFELWQIAEANPCGICDPYLLKKIDPGIFVIWQPTLDDLFATDWYIKQDHIFEEHLPKEEDKKKKKRFFGLF